MNIENIAQLRGGILPGPKPVTLVSCGDNKNSSILAVSYCGQISDEAFFVGIRPSRYSNELIEKHRRFAVHYLDASYVKEVDFCGIYSGRDIDKFKATGFTKNFGNFGTPLIGESPLVIECEVSDVALVNKHNLFLGRVVGLSSKNLEVDWLFHNNFDYLSKSGKVGELFKSGKKENFSLISS